MLSAMILAAGRGERLKPLTDHTPKPLVRVAGKPLAAWHLERLELAGIDQIVMNHAWLGDKLEHVMTEYWRGHHVPITFSREGQLGLEVGGGILKALPLLSDPFILINGDIFTHFDFQHLVEWAVHLKDEVEGRLILVPNPIQHPKGDFSIKEGKITLEEGLTRYTFSGMSILRHSLFKGYQAGIFVPFVKNILLPAIEKGRIEGIVIDDFWTDVGTPERLASIRQYYNDNTPPDQA